MTSLRFAQVNIERLRVKIFAQVDIVGEAHVSRADREVESQDLRSG